VTDRIRPTDPGDDRRHDRGPRLPPREPVGGYTPAPLCFGSMAAAEDKGFGCGMPWDISLIPAGNHRLGYRYIPAGTFRISVPSTCVISL
jgi:hypothetical protein